MILKNHILAKAVLLMVLMTSCSQEDNLLKEPTIDPNTHNGQEEIISLSNGNVVEKRDGFVFYEGDIGLTAEQFNNLRESGNIHGCWRL